MYDWNNFQRDTAIVVMDRLYAVLKMQCVDIVIDARFMETPFVPCEGELPYCRKLGNAVDARMAVQDGDPKLQRRFLMCHIPANT